MNVSPTIGKLELLLNLLPYVSGFATPAIRGWIIRMVPSKNIQTLIKAIDIMDETSKEVFNHKKMALKKGDEAVVHQIGEGNDIISILSRS